MANKTKIDFGNAGGTIASDATPLSANTAALKDTLNHGSTPGISTSASQATEKSVASSGPVSKVTDTALGVANAAVTVGTIVPFGAQIGLGVSGFALRKSGGLAEKWSVSKSAGQWLSGKGAKVAEVAKNVDEYKLSELGGTRIGRFFSRGAELAARGASNVMATVTNATGLGKKRVAANFESAAVEYGKAQRAAGAMNLAASTNTHLKDMHEALAAAHSAHAGGTFDPAHAEKYNTAREALSESKAELSKTLKKQLKGLDHTAEKAFAAHAAAEGWKDIKSTIRATPKSLGKVSAIHAVMSGAFIASDGLSIINDARAAMKEMKGVGQEVADMERAGVKDAAKSDVISAEKGKIIKHLIVNELGNAVSLLVNIKSAKNAKWGAKLSTMAAYVIPGVVATNVNGLIGDSALTMYEPLAEAYKNKEHIPAQAYAALLGAASEEIARRGGAQSAFAMALGKQYEAEQASPAQVMNEINNGHLMVRVAGIIKQSEAAKLEKHDQPTHSPIVSNTRQVSASPQHNRPVVGEGIHTGRLSSEPNTLQTGLA